MRGFRIFILEAQLSHSILQCTNQDFGISFALRFKFVATGLHAGDVVLIDGALAKAGHDAEDGGYPLALCLLFAGLLSLLERRAR